MTLKRLEEAFGVKYSLEEERKKFVQRIESKIFYKFSNYFSYHRVIEDSCNILGVNYKKGIEEEFYSTYFRFEKITKHDFFETLRVLVAIYQALDNDPEK